VNAPGKTYLSLTDLLPLTCIRTGTCCHSKMVWINPWELARLAAVKGLSSREFRDEYCEFGGIRLRFGTTPGWNGLSPCSQWLAHLGCSVYEGRPLVCRLFPIGRERRGKQLHYVHQGLQFPCLNECPEVVDRPKKTIIDYLKVQDVVDGEAAVDAYLGLMQRLADGAFVLLLESGLAATGDRLTLPLWRKLGSLAPEHLTEYLGSEWIDCLMLPQIGDGPEDPAMYAQRHYDLLQAQAQESFGNLTDVDTVREASGLMMGLALHLGRGLGINPADLAAQWIESAKELGARE
jgi:uncharacterized protein